MAVPLIAKALKVAKNAKMANDVRKGLKEGKETGGNNTIMSSNFSIKPWQIGIAVGALIVFEFAAVVVEFSNKLHIIQGVDSKYAGSIDDDGDGYKDGHILLLAGHSYEDIVTHNGKTDKYCNLAVVFDNPDCVEGKGECRDPTCRSRHATGYLETEENRKIVDAIRKELEALGVKVDVGNEILMRGSSRATQDHINKKNGEFYIERAVDYYGNFNKIDWKEYTYVLEIHFNAAGDSIQSSQQGSCVVHNENHEAINTEILDIIRKYNGGNVGRECNRFTQWGLEGPWDYQYFRAINTPMTYLEMEFFDNSSAMKKYEQNMNAIAKDIAKAIADRYGGSIGEWDEVYFNQGNGPWAHEPYDANGCNIAGCGCGLASITHCITLLTGKKLTPSDINKELRNWRNVGYYAPGGSVVAHLVQFAQEKYGFKMQHTYDIDEALKLMQKNRGVIICSDNGSGRNFKRADGSYYSADHVIMAYRTDGNNVWVKDSGTTNANSIKYTKDEFAKIRYVGFYVMWV